MLCPVNKNFLRTSFVALSGFSFRDGGDTLWVPLAVHVIEKVAGEIPDERVGKQVQILNRDYAAAKIQFYLPRYGPGGVPTCGVTRTVSPLANHDWTSEEDTLKRSVYWPPDSFLNVWIVSWMPMQVIGYARALGDTVSLPGVVLLGDVVGEGPGLRSPYDKGRTAVHEIGHVFSLMHPFEGGCRGTTPATCAIEGDEICDTPPQRQAHYGCPSLSTNTCQEVPTDLPDPVTNFMGYVDDGCMTHFTPEQIWRMRLFLLAYGTILISEENKQARGFRATLSPSCGSLSALGSESVNASGQGREPLISGAKILGLYDSAGRLIWREGGEKLDMSTLSPGLYIAIVMRGGIVFSHRLAVGCP